MRIREPAGRLADPIAGDVFAVVPQLSPRAAQRPGHVAPPEVEPGGLEDEITIPITDPLVAAQVHAALEQRSHRSTESLQDLIPPASVRERADDPGLRPADGQAGQRQLGRHPLGQRRQLLTGDVGRHANAAHGPAGDERVDDDVATQLRRIVAQGPALLTGREGRAPRGKTWRFPAADGSPDCVSAIPGRAEAGTLAQYTPFDLAPGRPDSALFSARSGPIRRADDDRGGGQARHRPLYNLLRP